MSPGPPTRTDMNPRRTEWINKCVSNFSLYANLIGNNCDDPYDEAAAIEAGDFKLKMSKSAKKRLRKQNKKRKTNLERVAPAHIRKLNLALARKQSKKDIKKITDKFETLLNMASITTIPPGSLANGMPKCGDKLESMQIVPTTAAASTTTSSFLHSKLDSSAAYRS